MRSVELFDSHTTSPPRSRPQMQRLFDRVAAREENLVRRPHRTCVPCDITTIDHFFSTPSSSAIFFVAFWPTHSRRNKMATNRSLRPAVLTRTARAGDVALNHMHDA